MVVCLCDFCKLWLYSDSRVETKKLGLLAEPYLEGEQSMCRLVGQMQHMIHPGYKFPRGARFVRSGFVRSCISSFCFYLRGCDLFQCTKINK